MSHSIYLLWLLAGLLLGFLFYLYRRWAASLPPSSFSSFPSHSVEVEGTTFRYHRSGRGPHLLLIHGLGANLYCWRFIVPLLTNRFTVTALDLPGFGQSRTNAPATYGLDEQTARLTAFLDALKIKRTFVVGNSMGGNLALWLALHHAKRIAGCAVIAPATSNKLLRIPLSRWTVLARPAALLLTRQAMAWAHRRTVTRKDLVDLERVEETFKTYGGQDEAVKTFMLATEAIRDPRLPKALAHVKAKVLILWGSADLLVSRAVIDELEETLLHSESFVHVGGGHHLQEDEPEWVSAKLIEFFTQNPDV